MKKKTKKDDVFGHGVKPLILLFLLISGSCGLVYEILWMKMLTLVIGNTVFSITTVLTAFMGGLALGSFLAGSFIDKIKLNSNKEKELFETAKDFSISNFASEKVKWKDSEKSFL